VWPALDELLKKLHGGVRKANGLSLLAAAGSAELKVELGRIRLGLVVIIHAGRFVQVPAGAAVS
jgi:hypothetical protein